MNKQIEQFPALQRCRAKKKALEARLEVMEYLLHQAVRLEPTLLALKAYQQFATRQEQVEPLTDEDGR